MSSDDVCTHCHGACVVLERIQVSPTKWDIVHRPCPACHGSGKKP